MFQVAALFVYCKNAVVKDSDHPCNDFRDLMMQMVAGKVIYNRSGLEELLKGFFEINSPWFQI
ncbi:hypothetical protein LINPERPRIM_LOCUS2746 [Linum perenne]